jgi:hypothetical protein
LDVDPPVILVLASEWKSEASPLVLHARISDRSGVREATVWIMGEEDEDYWPLPMRPSSDGNYFAQVLPSPERGAAFVYYVEALDRLGNGPRRSGTPGNPFVARVSEEVVPVSEAGSRQKEVAMGLLLAPLALLWLIYRQDRSHRERGFWIALLEPLAHKRGSELAQAIDALCARKHRHPHRGEVRLSKVEARRWLQQLRQSGKVRSKPLRPQPGRPAGNTPGDNVFWLPSSEERPPSA